MLEVQEMVFANTFSEKYQSTYFPAAGSPTRIDFIALPAAAASRTTRVTTLAREGRQLQIIPDSKPRDHRPLAAWVDLKLAYT
eukprot:6437344-Alexandrium_andersonii.AAC.1